MKLSVAILISGSGSNMVQLIKSMGHEHPAFPSIVISNKSDALGLKKAQDLGIPTKVIDQNLIKNNSLNFEIELINILIENKINIICVFALSDTDTGKWAALRALQSGTVKIRFKASLEEYVVVGCGFAFRQVERLI